MKIENLYIGLMFTSASILTGCGEYEDTETTSPQADANAIGANFASEMQNAQVTPDSISFDMAMNRVNPEGAKVIKVNTLKNTNTFCTPPTEFNFEDGKMATKKTVLYDISKCTFQKPDTLTIKIDADAKDHIYGDGYLQTSVAFVVDYTWKDSIDAIVHDEYISSENFPAKVQVAMDFDKKKEKTRTLIRLADYFKNAGKTTKDGAAHIQFAIDKDINKGNPKLVFDEPLNGIGNIKFNKDKIETGLSVNVDVNEDGEIKEDELAEVFMKDLAVRTPSTSTEDANESNDITYEITYKLYYLKKDKTTQISVKDDCKSTITVKFPKEETSSTVE